MKKLTSNNSALPGKMATNASVEDLKSATAIEEIIPKGSKQRTTHRKRFKSLGKLVRAGMSAAAFLGVTNTSLLQS